MGRVEMLFWMEVIGRTFFLDVDDDDDMRSLLCLEWMLCFLSVRPPKNTARVFWKYEIVSLISAQRRVEAVKSQGVQQSNRRSNGGEMERQKVKG